MQNRIREVRRSKNLSQLALAEKAGISRVSVQRYETNGTVPSAEVLYRVAKALDTTIDNLIGDTGEEAG